MNFFSLFSKQEATSENYSFPLPKKRFHEEGQRLSSDIPKRKITIIGNYYTTSPKKTHSGSFKHAIDFLVPDGTDVLAASDGQVIKVVENFSTWGSSENFKNELNYITISHLNGEFSQYCHLEKDSFSKIGLKVGDFVKRGQKIATVGKTGHTDRDHLHFIVFKNGKLKGSPFNFYSLKIKFS